MTHGITFVEIEGKKAAHYDINDTKNRYHISQPSTLREIAKISGGEVFLRGKYITDRSMASISEPPLYIQIKGSQLQLKKAIEYISKIKDRSSTDILKDLEVVVPFDNKEAVLDTSFNLKQRLVGTQGSYFKYIQNKTYCTVQLKSTKDKSYLGIHLIAPSNDMLKKAEDLVIDLISTIKREYDRFVKRRDQATKSMQSIEQMNSRYYMPPQ